MKACCVLILSVFTAVEIATAQDSTSTMWSVGTGYSSFKDELAVGLLYQGFAIDGSFAQRYSFEGAEVSWSILLSLNTVFSRGATAFDVYFKPWNGGALFTVVDGRWSLAIGPGLTGSYHTYLNPFVNSGHFFWYTHYDLELRLASSFTIEDQQVRMQLNTAVLSLASRPEAMPDPYFYSWSLGDMITRAHSNMVVASIDKVQHTDLTIEWFPSSCDGEISLAYVMSYDRYRPDPELQILQHLVRLTWY